MKSFRKISKISLNTTKPISKLFGFDRGTPIDRYYIEKFLAENSQYIRGSVLEIAEDTYSKKFASGEIRQEILHFDNTNPNATIVGDLTKIETLPENTADCFICTQTFNFIYDVKSSLLGAKHLLKDGGVLLATVGGLSQISRYDMDRWGDYWRFTDKSLEMLAKEAGFSKASVIIYGNAMAATAFIQGLAQEDLKDLKMLDETDEDYQIILGLVAKK
ncbi:MAG: methyltransferase domain-containing protein [Candidatus Gastranaerophilaceae bacterium]